MFFVTNTCVIELNTYIPTGNKIGDRNATSLSESLESNTTLTQLDLKSEDQRKEGT